MRKLLIEIDVLEGIKISDDQIKENIQYILNQHFIEMESYSTVDPPQVKEINFVKGTAH